MKNSTLKLRSTFSSLSQAKAFEVRFSDILIYYIAVMTRLQQYGIRSIWNETIYRLLLPMHISPVKTTLRYNVLFAKIRRLSLRYGKNV